MESADYLDFGNPDAGQGKPRNNERKEYLFSLISPNIDMINDQF